MNVNKQILITFLLMLMFVACNRNDVAIDRAGTSPGVVNDANKDYYWKYSWQRNGGDNYEIKIDSQKLTDLAINKGIKIYVAIYSDWSSFERVPQTLYDVSLPDTVNLSYNLIPGHLKIFAKAPFEIIWPCDIMLDYQR